MRRSLRALALVLGVAMLLPVWGTAALADGHSITRIAVTQVLGQQADRYVAGKDTVVRVFLSAAILPDVAAHKLVVKRGGTTVVTLAPTPSASAVRSLVFACPSRADCGDWAAGDYTFEATVGAATASTTATFRTRSRVSILAVPVKANYGAGDVRSPDDSWKKMGEFTRRIYPLAPEDFKWHIGNELDASDIKFNLKTNDGMFELWKALAELQPVECRQAPKPAGVTCYDKIVGFVRDRQGETGSIQGYTMGKPANVVTATDEDAQATVAHEIGHNYALGDEYLGGQYNCAVNPTPAEYVGKDFTQQAAPPFSCTGSTVKAWPHGGTGVTVEAETELPFEIGGRGALPDMTSFMGSGAKQDQNWVSLNTWKQLFDLSDPAKAAAARASAVVTAAAERYISVAGELTGTADTVTLEPWYSYTSTTHPASTTGAYTIRAVDSAGTVLASSKLDIESDLPEPIPGFDTRFFQASVGYPAATARFEIVRGTTVLKTVTPSRNAPVVAITSPAAGGTMTGTFTVRWTSSDADNDALVHRVEYSPNNGKDWYALIGDLAAKEWTEDFATLPGTGKAEALIRVVASDGLNATTATSTPFIVPAKAPEPEIAFPETAYDEMTAGQELWLAGGAFDYLDDWVAETGIVWSSNLQGQLGTGEVVVSTKLQPGTHTITLAATNSLGLKSSLNATIAVFPAGRTVTVADVYAIYKLYLGRFPTYGAETAPRIGTDFGAFVEEVRWSEEALLVQGVGFVPEAKSAYTGRPLPR